MKYLIFIVLWFACGAQSDYSQQIATRPVRNLSEFAYAKPTSCAFRNAELDVIHQTTPSDGVISVVARLGDDDSKPGLNERRLQNVKAYWTQFLSPPHRRNPNTIVLTEGDTVKGYGQLEFYRQGKLIDLMKIAPNADVTIGECYPPDDTYVRKHVFNACEVKSNKIFYPCKRDKPLSRRRR